MTGVMYMNFRRWAFFPALVLLVWFLADAQAVRAAAAEALALCAGSVIPALFPFLVVSSLLLKLGFGQALAPWLAELMEPLFRVDGAGGAALVLGLAGGYPVGARTASELYTSGALSRPEAERLLTFANTANPVFLISVLGVGVFGSVRTGVWLWLIHVLAALLTGLAFRGWGGSARSHTGAPAAPAQPAPSLPAALVQSVAEGLAAMGSVCAFVVFFYVLSRPLAALGGTAGTAAVGLTELFSLTPLLTADAPGFVLAAAMSGWGGLSVLCQTAAVVERSGLRMGPAAAGKAVHGLLSGLLAAALAGYVLA